MIGPPKGRNGHRIFVDTKRGTFTVCDFQVGPVEPTDLSEDLDEIENAVTQVDEQGEKRTENWIEYPTFTTANFLAKITRELIGPELIPDSDGELRFASANGADGEMMKEIVRGQGWPGESYNKQECLKKLDEYINGD